MTVEQLLQEALRLPDGERATLATRLLESLDQEVGDDTPEAWASEIQKRLAELDSGAVKPVPWEEVRRKLMGESDGPSR